LTVWRKDKVIAQGWPAWFSALVCTPCYLAYLLDKKKVSRVAPANYADEGSGQVDTIATPANEAEEGSGQVDAIATPPSAFLLRPVDSRPGMIRF
jgi:hypothetical protein